MDRGTVTMIAQSHKAPYVGFHPEHRDPEPWGQHRPWRPSVPGQHVDYLHSSEPQSGDFRWFKAEAQTQNSPARLSGRSSLLGDPVCSLQLSWERRGDWIGVPWVALKAGTFRPPGQPGATGTADEPRLKCRPHWAPSSRLPSWGVAP